MRQGPVLIVEHDSAVSASIASRLKAVGFEVRRADLSGAAPSVVKGRDSDVALLGMRQPDNCEMEPAHAVGSSRYPVAVIVITVHTDNEDRLEPLHLNADEDGTGHPAIADLVERLLEAIGHVRSPQGRAVSSLQVGDICLDALAHRVTKAERYVHLTPKEFKLLHVLMEHQGLPLTHHQLLELVWGPEHRGKRDYLRTYMSQLRRKLEADPSSPKYLLTESHMGYRFQPPSAATP